ncbi:MAG TPA: hypothetical protein PL005_00710 [Candidatus Hydrogenedentes bacterium]|nr:hypothetical protein [Candidatus Hydrogenedentota bacterium]
MSTPRAHTGTHRRGAALLMALGMLALFSVLGAAYVRSMSLEDEAASLRARQARTEEAAAGAVRGAAAALRRALAENDGLGMLADRSFRMPVHALTRAGRGTGEGALTPQPLPDTFVRVRLTVAEMDPAALAADDPAAGAVRAAAPGAGRFFRVTARAALVEQTGGGERSRAPAAVEAVALADGSGTTFVYWNGTDEPYAGPPR